MALAKIMFGILMERNSKQVNRVRNKAATNDPRCSLQRKTKKEINDEFLSKTI